MKDLESRVDDPLVIFNRAIAPGIKNPKDKIWMAVLNQLRENIKAQPSREEQYSLAVSYLGRIANGPISDKELIVYE